MKNKVKIESLDLSDCFKRNGSSYMVIGKDSFWKHSKVIISKKHKAGAIIDFYRDVIVEVENNPALVKVCT